MRGKKKKQKKAGCWSMFTPRKSAKKENYIAGGAIDVGSSEIEIPGGLAGIRERMALMGHSMNAPPPPDDFDTAPTGPHAPSANSERMAGEGFVLESDFCTHDGHPRGELPRQFNISGHGPTHQKLAQAAEGAPGRIAKRRPSKSEATRDDAQRPSTPVDPTVLAKLDVLNSNGSEMTVEQLLDLFTDATPPLPADTAAPAPPAPPATPATRSSPPPPRVPEYPERDTPSPLALPSPPLSPTPDTQRHNNAIETSALPTPKSAGSHSTYVPNMPQELSGASAVSAPLASADSAHTTPTEGELKKETAAPADAPPNGCENTPLRSQARRDLGALGTPAEKKEEKAVARTAANCEKEGRDAAAASGCRESGVEEEGCEGWEEGVAFTLTLDGDLNSIGDKETFKREVVKDVASAAKIHAKYVRVTALRAGSVLVDLLIAKAAGDAHEIVRELEAQLKSPSSPLMQGKVTSKCKSARSRGAPAEDPSSRGAQAEDPSSHGAPAEDLSSRAETDDESQRVAELHAKFDILWASGSSAFAPSEFAASGGSPAAATSATTTPRAAATAATITTTQDVSSAVTPLSPAASSQLPLPLPAVCDAAAPVRDTGTPAANSLRPLPLALRRELDAVISGVVAISGGALSADDSDTYDAQNAWDKRKSVAELASRAIVSSNHAAHAAHGVDSTISPRLDEFATPRRVRDASPQTLRHVQELHPSSCTPPHPAEAEEGGERRAGGVANSSSRHNGSAKWLAHLAELRRMQAQLEEESSLFQDAVSSALAAAHTPARPEDELAARLYRQGGCPAVAAPVAVRDAAQVRDMGSGDGGRVSVRATAQFASLRHDGRQSQRSDALPSVSAYSVSSIKGARERDLFFNSIERDSVADLNGSHDSSFSSQAVPLGSLLRPPPQRPLRSARLTLSDVKEEDTIESRIRAFREARPEGSFQQWLLELTPEDITRAVAAAKGGTGVWRQIWDKCGEELKVKEEDTIASRIRAFRGARPEGSFQQWLLELTPEDITRAVAVSKGSTGVWRKLWDQTLPGVAP